VIYSEREVSKKNTKPDPVGRTVIWGNTREYRGNIEEEPRMRGIKKTRECCDDRV